MWGSGTDRIHQNKNVPGCIKGFFNTLVIGAISVGEGERDRACHFAADWKNRPERMVKCNNSVLGTAKLFDECGRRLDATDCCLGTVALHISDGFEDINGACAVVGALESKGVIDEFDFAAHVFLILKLNQMKQTNLRGLYLREEQLSSWELSLADFQGQAGRPFEHEGRLRELVARQAELNAMLDLDKGEQRQIAQPADGEAEACSDQISAASAPGVSCRGESAGRDMAMVPPDTGDELDEENEALVVNVHKTGGRPKV